MTYSSKEDIEIERIFNQRMQSSGFIVHSAVLNHLVDVYSMFMKSAENISINKSKIKQVIETRNERILFFSANLKWLHDMNKNPISLNLKAEKKVIKSLSNFSLVDDRVGVTEFDDSYCFSDLKNDVNIPKSSVSNKNRPNLRKRSYINYRFEDSDLNIILGAFRNEDIIKEIRRWFDSTKPVDILISDKKILAFKQEGRLVNTNYFCTNINSNHADIILRSHHMLYFNQKEPLCETMKIIHSQEDGKYWLMTSALYWKAHTRFKVYEELEVVKIF